MDDQQRDIEAVEQALQDAASCGAPLPAESATWMRQAAREGWLERYKREWLPRDLALYRGWPDPFNWPAPVPAPAAPPDPNGYPVEGIGALEGLEPTRRRPS